MAGKLRGFGRHAELTADAPLQEGPVGPIRRMTLHRTTSLFGASTGGRKMAPTSSSATSYGSSLDDRKIWERMPASDDVETEAPVRPMLARPNGPQRTNSLDAVASRPVVCTITTDVMSRVRNSSSSPTFLEAHYGRLAAMSDVDSGEDTDEIQTPNTSVDINPMLNQQLTAKAIMQDNEAATLLLLLGGNR